MRHDIRDTPIDQLRPHPRNPRHGNLDAITESITANGWYGTIVAQASTGHILAGNHRWQAARNAGMATVPVHWVDVDDQTAVRILLADNRTSDLADYDNSMLAELLDELTATSSIEGTGWTPDDLEQLLAETAPPPRTR